MKQSCTPEDIITISLYPYFWNVRYICRNLHVRECREGRKRKIRCGFFFNVSLKFACFILENFVADQQASWWLNAHLVLAIKNMPSIWNQFYSKILYLCLNLFIFSPSHFVVSVFELHQKCHIRMRLHFVHRETQPRPYWSFFDVWFWFYEIQNGPTSLPRARASWCCPGLQFETSQFCSQKNELNSLFQKLYWLIFTVAWCLILELRRLADKVTDERSRLNCYY